MKNNNTFSEIVKRNISNEPSRQHPLTVLVSKVYTSYNWRVLIVHITGVPNYNMYSEDWTVKEGSSPNNSAIRRTLPSSCLIDEFQPMFTFNRSDTRLHPRFARRLNTARNVDTRNQRGEQAQRGRRWEFLRFQDDWMNTLGPGDDASFIHVNFQERNFSCPFPC